MTVPSTIEAGEVVTIPAGRMAVLPNLSIEGELVIDGEVFIPSGTTFDKVVELEGDQTIDDVKTFLKSPIVPTPITGDSSTRVATTEYVSTEITNRSFGAFKNYIIDGRFDFWYEGTSQTTSGYGSDTMWNNTNLGSTKTHSRQSFAIGETFPDETPCPTYFSRTVVNSVSGAGNFVCKDHRIEDVTRLAGKTVTLSFWAKASAVRNISIEFEQNFGTGGSPSTAVNGIGANKISIGTTWQKITRTITIPSISGKTIGSNGVNTSLTVFRFWFDAGSNYNSRTDNLGQQSGTFDIAMVQIEEGNVATSFENTDIGTMASIIDRYYQPINELPIVHGVATYSGAKVTYSFNYRRGMRKIPAGVNIFWANGFNAIPSEIAISFSLIHAALLPTTLGVNYSAQLNLGALDARL